MTIFPYRTSVVSRAARLDEADMVAGMREPHAAVAKAASADDRRSALLRTWVLIMLFLALGSALAFTGAGPVAAIGRHVSFAANEGWNAYWAESALAGRALYTSPSSPITNNYTPLSFYIVGWLGHRLGDVIVAGRIVCLAALLGCAVLVRQIVVELGGTQRWALAAALCLLLFVAAAAPTYVAANDPQWLAELPMLVALVLLVRRGSTPGFARLSIACGMMLLSGLIKQSGIALPIAVTVWLTLTDRRALRIWIMIAAVAGIAALAWLHRFGPTAISEILGHERVLHVGLLASAAKTLTPLLPAMLFAVVLARARRVRSLPFDRNLLLVFLFAGVALVLGIVERMGTGTAQSVHFDAAIALFIIAGLALSRGDMSNHALVASWPRLAAFALLIVPMIGTAFIHNPGAIGRIAGQDEAEKDTERAVALVRAMPGAVACERLAICYWAGKPFILDFSNYGQKLRRHDPAGLERAIERRAFSAILSVRDKRYAAYNSRLPLSYNRLIEANYRVRQILPDGIYLLVPRK
jgi:hypothetical protein